MPHYHIVEATEAVKPVLGEYFVEPEKSGPIPFHLIKRFFKGTEVGTVPAGGRTRRCLGVVSQYVAVLLF